MPDSVDNLRQQLLAAQQEVKRWRDLYHELFGSIQEGFAIHEVILDAEQRPLDYRFLEVNRAFEQITGLAARDIVGRTVREVLPAVESYWIETYGRVALTGKAETVENYSAGLGGRDFEVYAFSPRKNHFATLFFDVTARKAAQDELLKARADLEIRVQERTADLIAANAALEEEVKRRRHAQRKLQKKQRALHRILKLHEQERQLTATEIHDGLVQQLLGAKMHLEGFRFQVESKCQEHLETFDHIVHLLATAVDEGRRMINQVRPLIIGDGIVPAIRFLIQEQRMQHRFEVQFEHPRNFPRMTWLLEVSVFRIVQQAINNARRHSGVERAHIKLDHDEQQLRLEVLDRGVGFNPERVLDCRSGLKDIIERAQLFGGTARIESTPGAGTRVYAQIPIVKDVD